MAASNLAMAMSSTPAPAVWAKASQALRVELGDDAFGSWLARAVLKPAPDGTLYLVTPTGIARDWVRRYAWRRIEELWALHDPDSRAIALKSRAELDSDGECASPLRDTPSAPASSLPVATPDATVGARTPRDRFTFDTFVTGPANEFAHAVARRVASWADGHFNPVVIHGPYGLGKTHLLCAMAREASLTAPDKKVVYLTAERFLSGFVRAAMERQLGPFKEELRGCRSVDRRCRALHRRQAVHPGRAVPHPGGADGGRPAGGVLGRSATLGAHRVQRPSALSSLRRLGVRHRAGRPGAAARHPQAQVGNPARPVRFYRRAAAGGAGLPGRPLHRQCP